MKKTVLTFGVISGLISTVTMLATIPFMHKISGEKGLIIGYTTMVLAGLLVFFGVRSYRDNVSGGKLTFARGFLVGILISVLSNCFYVGTWEIAYFNFMPNFAEKYAAQIEREAAEFVRNYHKPLYNISMTFLEVFPVFLVITLLSAAILRKKPANAPA
jgi:hypothetical protein